MARRVLSLEEVMRILIGIAVLGLSRIASADAHDEMAAALVEQADLHPTPVMLPVKAAAPRHAAAQSAVKRGIAPRGVVIDHARTAASAAAQQTQGASAVLVHQAQAATAAAAGQAQAQAAKDRASRPRPR